MAAEVAPLSTEVAQQQQQEPTLQEEAALLPPPELQVVAALPQKLQAAELEAALPQLQAAELEAALPQLQAALRAMAPAKQLQHQLQEVMHALLAAVEEQALQS